MNCHDAIQKWFQTKELSELYYPLNINKIVEEIGFLFNLEFTENEILQTMDGNSDLIYKLFENLRGHKGKNRPHCLYLFSKNFLGIDQEDCIINTIEKLFIEKGYKVTKEVNYIDLIIENEDEIWLIEVKGKQAYEWTSYAFSQGLEQCFPLDFNESLLKIRKTIGFGKSISTKGQMLQYQSKKHKHISIVVPGFSPTIIWNNSTEKKLLDQIYHREIEELSSFINKKVNSSINSFGKYIRLLNEQHNIIEHYNSCNLDWCFHILEFRGFYEYIDFVFYDSIKNKVIDF